MSMQTAYVPINWEQRDGTKRAEFRIDNDEAYEGRLQMGVNSYATGDEFGMAHLSRESVIAVRDALDGWLASNPGNDV